MIRHFHEAGHKVTVCSLVRSEQEAREGCGIAPYCTRYFMESIGKIAGLLRMVLRLAGRQPSSMGYFYSPRLARRIRELVASEDFDFIFVHCSSVAQYVEEVGDVPKQLDFGDMDSQKWLAYSKTKPFPLSMGYALEGHKLQREEARLSREFDLCSCTTQAEMNTLVSYNTGVKTGWFPNGVDSEFFSPTDEPYDPNMLCFVGRMDYYPNQRCMFDFCRDTLPLIQKVAPKARLVIVGADPSPAVLALNRLPGVTVTGSVPEVQPIVLKAALTVAPLDIARGTQNKILESLAMGVPVVCSSLAAGGVDAVPGEHLLTADDPQSLAQAVLRLLTNPSERTRFSQAGRARVLSHHAWESSMKRLDTLVDLCLGQDHESQYCGRL